MSDFIRHVNFLSGSTIFEEFFSLFIRTKKKKEMKVLLYLHFCQILIWYFSKSMYIELEPFQSILKAKWAINFHFLKYMMIAPRAFFFIKSYFWKSNVFFKNLKSMKWIKCLKYLTPVQGRCLQNRRKTSPISCLKNF